MAPLAAENSPPKAGRAASAPAGQARPRDREPAKDRRGEIGSAQPGQPGVTDPLAPASASGARGPLRPVAGTEAVACSALAGGCIRGRVSADSRGGSAMPCWTGRGGICVRLRSKRAAGPPSRGLFSSRLSSPTRQAALVRTVPLLRRPCRGASPATGRCRRAARGPVLPTTGFVNPAAGSDRTDADPCKCSRDNERSAREPVRQGVALCEPVSPSAFAAGDARQEAL